MSDKPTYTRAGRKLPEMPPLPEPRYPSTLGSRIGNWLLVKLTPWKR